MYFLDLLMDFRIYFQIYTLMVILLLRSFKHLQNSYYILIDIQSEIE